MILKWFHSSHVLTEWDRTLTIILTFRSTQTLQIDSSINIQNDSPTECSTAVSTVFTSSSDYQHLVNFEKVTTPYSRPRLFCGVFNCARYGFLPQSISLTSSIFVIFLAPITPSNQLQSFTQIIHSNHSLHCSISPRHCLSHSISESYPISISIQSSFSFFTPLNRRCWSFQRNYRLSISDLL